MITRQNGKPAVVISLEDFQAYEETAHLMDSPKNAERLNQAIAEVEVGRMTALEAMSDLYRTLPEAAGQDWLQDSRATDLADDIFEKNDD
jgi:antitoxin YefM